MQVICARCDTEFEFSDEDFDKDIDPVCPKCGMSGATIVIAFPMIKDE